MRALITGSAGFVGRHMHAACLTRGYDVTAIDIRNGDNALDFFRWGDLTYYDLVIHCAANVGGRTNIDGNPLLVGAVNQQLDAALFDWVASNNPGRVVYFSSSAVYPQDHQSAELETRLSEDLVRFEYPLGAPETSYGWAKYAGEVLARYAQAEGHKVHVFRPFSGYGADQDDTYPFPAFIDRARRRERRFDIWGNGRQVRDFVHIDDIVGAVFAAIDQDTTEPLNIGWGRPVSMDRLAEIVTTEAGYKPKFRHLTKQPQGVSYRVADPTSMLRVYNPKITLEEGVRRALR